MSLTSFKKKTKRKHKYYSRVETNSKYLTEKLTCYWSPIKKVNNHASACVCVCLLAKYCIKLSDIFKMSQQNIFRV